MLSRYRWSTTITVPTFCPPCFVPQPILSHPPFASFIPFSSFRAGDSSAESTALLYPPAARHRLSPLVASSSAHRLTQWLPNQPVSEASSRCHLHCQPILSSNLPTPPSPSSRPFFLIAHHEPRRRLLFPKISSALQQTSQRPSEPQFSHSEESNQYYVAQETPFCSCIPQFLSEPESRASADQIQRLRLFVLPRPE